MIKNILITGAGGFIGRNLKEHLKDKYNLLTPSHLELDLMDSEAVKDYFNINPIDIVVHCASAGAKGYKGVGAEKIPQQIDVVSQNLRMFFNILDNLKDKRLINFGSGAEYDKTKEITKVREGDFGKSVPPEMYAFSKYAISKYIESSDRDIINLRFFAIYGKYEDYKVRFISRAICRNLLGLPIVINKNAVFDYLYIDDVAKIVDYFINNKSSEKIYNAGSGNPIELLAVAQLINEIAGNPSEIIVQNPGFNNEYSCDISKLKKELGEFEFIPLKEGIKRLYDYYKENLNEIDKKGLV
ncbi:MAG: NAD(P)-dependent oxidoreductase [Nanoarchaeota archaeon]